MSDFLSRNEVCVLSGSPAEALIDHLKILRSKGLPSARELLKLISRWFRSVSIDGDNYVYTVKDEINNTVRVSFISYKGVCGSFFYVYDELLRRITLLIIDIFNLVVDQKRAFSSLSDLAGTTNKSNSLKNNGLRQASDFSITDRYMTLRARFDWLNEPISLLLRSIFVSESNAYSATLNTKFVNLVAIDLGLWLDAAHESMVSDYCYVLIASDCTIVAQALGHRCTTQPNIYFDADGGMYLAAPWMHSRKVELAVGKAVFDGHKLSLDKVSPMGNGALRFLSRDYDLRVEQADTADPGRYQEKGLVFQKLMLDGSCAADDGETPDRLAAAGGVRHFREASIASQYVTVQRLKAAIEFAPFDCNVASGAVDTGDLVSADNDVQVMFAIARDDIVLVAVDVPHRGVYDLKGTEFVARSHSLDDLTRIEGAAVADVPHYPNSYAFWTRMFDGHYAADGDDTVDQFAAAGGVHRFHNVKGEANNPPIEEVRTSGALQRAHDAQMVAEVAT